MFKDTTNPVLDAVRTVFYNRHPVFHERIYEDLKTTHGKEHRHYHTLRHITEMLELTEKFELQNKRAFLAAVLYHDYIYEPERYAPDYAGLSNEKESALCAERIMLENDVDPGIIFRTKQLILMTEKHKAPKDDNEAALFMDIDMSIVSAPHRRYSEYASANAREYLQVFMPEKYMAGRRAFFENVEATKGAVFKTPHFAYLEEKALVNIQWERENLAQITSTAFLTNYVVKHKADYK